MEQNVSLSECSSVRQVFCRCLELETNCNGSVSFLNSLFSGLALCLISIFECDCSSQSVFACQSTTDSSILFGGSGQKPNRFELAHFHKANLSSMSGWEFLHPLSCGGEFHLYTEFQTAWLSRVFFGYSLVVPKASKDQKATGTLNPSFGYSRWLISSLS